ncbi:MAG: NifB/NifX family molybdenum-iron cluster-binding protein [Kiritimatiellae bacterium]|nr:NifB/NifX family molybdenum-iron cluster-binding protein [Kiritimatiellia bacterium]
MKLALATWNGRISPVFDVARQVMMLDVEDDRVVARHEETLPGTEPQAQVGRLATLAPQTLICGAISDPLAGLLVAKGIQVISFISGTVEEVLTAHLSGTLLKPAFAMPGCCGRGGRFRGSGAGHGRGACFGGRRLVM